MQKVLLVLAMIGFAGLGLTAVAPPAVAAQPCTGIVTGPINGGLVVTSGQCIVNNAQINGGIEVDGGNLYVCNSTVSGGIHNGTVSGGSITRIGEADLEGQIGLPPGLPSCPGDTVNGGIQISGNGFVEIDGTTVNGPTALTNTTSAFGGLNGEVEGSTFHGSLSCGPGYYNDTSRTNTVTGTNTCPSVH